ncbi:hypothetical protein CcCBS67573_g04614 [Chytriomyces confervae]|uniref:Uncharacterized protein n=1 Tax=Chytriomyces confervae TaxID=246404 RepID=A0A507FCQ0_9FUNG|nr:hypothetical protein HDU80_003357 [Chytriomyces hyalinus]TPX74119.1 hypothetical protein CcCBS67573_g04614 [Chytriomyces confervae]
MSQAEKPPCKYGLGCYRKNPAHFEEFSHPQPSTAADIASGAAMFTPSNPKPEFRYKMLPIYTFRETLYLRVLNEILIKPDWLTKLHNKEILSKWKTETRGALRKLIDASGISGADPLPAAEDVIPHVTDGTFIAQSIDFLFQELNYIAEHGLVVTKDEAIIAPTSSHGVYMSDNLISTELVAQLALHAAQLEQESLQKKKWHEGSNEQVLDLVHPSDYPLVYGSSKQRRNPLSPLGLNTIKPPEGMRSSARQRFGASPDDVSQKFQWLPSEFKVDAETGKVTIRSYINNLHRTKHAALYNDISQIFEHMVPMFELALGSFSSDSITRIPNSMDNAKYQVEQDEWLIDEFMIRKYGSGVDLKDEELRDKAGNADDYYDFCDEVHSGSDRPAYMPGLPAKFVKEEHGSRVTPMKLGGKSVQVIVKMATIHLSPEKPEYGGGSWHLEGMENEAIAATGIVYYGMSNITSSRLTFRSVFNTDEGSLFEYGQSDFGGLEKVFGFKNESSDNTQICGQIEARERRSIVFPNFLHHKVEPFELVDKSKPGFRKILAFFVVHPDFRVYSTHDVGIQQVDWAADELFALAFGKKLPLEIVRLIAEYSGATFSGDDALKFAHELSEERKNTPKDGYANVQKIYLCEH